MKGEIMIKKKLQEIGKMFASTPAEETENKDFIELTPTAEEDKNTAKIILKYYLLKDFSDIKNVLDDIRTGYTIGLLNVRALKEKNMNELKRTIEKIKKTSNALGGDLIGLDEKWVIIRPSYVDIKKGE